MLEGVLCVDPNVTKSRIISSVLYSRLSKPIHLLTMVLADCRQRLTLFSPQVSTVYNTIISSFLCLVAVLTLLGLSMPSNNIDVQMHTF